MCHLHPIQTHFIRRSPKFINLSRSRSILLTSRIIPKAFSLCFTTETQKRTWVACWEQASGRRCQSFIGKSLLRVPSHSFVQAAWYEYIQIITEKHGFRQQYVALWVQAMKSFCYIIYSDNSALLGSREPSVRFERMKITIFWNMRCMKNIDRLPLRRVVSLSFPFF